VSGERGKKDGRRGRHIQRRKVVFGDLVAPESEPFGLDHILDALFVLLVKRYYIGVLRLEVIPDAELKLHRAFLHRVSRSSQLRCRLMRPATLR
jgi:hypothetical protein